MIGMRAALFIGLAVAAVMPSAAGAADLYGGSIKDSYAPMQPAASSIYLRIDGGYAVHDDPTMVENGIYDLTDTSMGSAWTLGGGIGRYFTNTIRADVTYDHRFESDVEGNLDSAHPSALPGKRAFGLESDVVLVNAYYDFNRTGRFNPYLGLGLGVVHHSTAEGTVSDECGCIGTIAEGSSTHVAGALMAGFSAKLRGGEPVYGGGIKDAPVAMDSGRALYLDVGYRFLYLGETATGAVTMNNGGGTLVSRDPTVEEIHAHEIRVGLRYDLR